MYVVANATTVFSDAEERETRSFCTPPRFSDDDDGLFRCGGGRILRAIGQLRSIVQRIALRKWRKLSRSRKTWEEEGLEVVVEVVVAVGRKQEKTTVMGIMKTRT